IIVIGGQGGDEPQWQPGHGAAFQISTAVGAEIPLPGTLLLLAAALGALSLIRRRAAARSNDGELPPQPSDAEPAAGSVAGAASTNLQVASASTLRTAAGGRRVQGHGGSNEGLQSLPIQLVAFVEVDGAPDVAFETGVEDP